MMKKSSQYVRLVTRLCLLAGFALVLGYFTDHYVIALLLTVTGLFAWYNINLIKLNNWLWYKKSLFPPQSRGIWRDVFDGIYKLQMKNRARRKELGELLKRFREGAEALPDAVVLTQKDGEIVWCNKLAQHIFGFRWPGDSGVRVDNLLRNPVFVDAFTKKRIEDILIIPSPVNPDRAIEVRIVPYSYDQYLMIGRDVTQVQRLNQMRKDFIANVSHELRTPLTVLQGYLEMMQDPDMRDAMAGDKAINMMHGQCERMLNLVNQLLTLSRIEANQESVFERVVNVPLLLSMVEKEAHQLNHDRNHEIIFEVDDQLLVNGIEDELRSAFTNLVKNAIRYTPDNGQIIVRWQRQNEQALFAVSDDGDGIAQQHVSRLTERFYRIDKARSRATGGSGLGLSIVKHVLAHHNSELEIESVVGEGSTFKFHLPNELIVEKDTADY